MDEIHQMHHYGKYSFLDIMEMTVQERRALNSRMFTQLKAEQDHINKMNKG
jgi:hypothetical protein